MQQNDKKKFSQIMLGMADNFRDSITKEGMAMRFGMLKDFTIEQIETAAKKIMATRKYTKMPPIAEFIEALQGSELKIEDRALVMANRIIDHLRRCGALVYPDLSDDPIAQYLMAGRWAYHQWAKYVLESELKWWVKEFCDAYRAYLNIEAQPQIENKRMKMIAGGMLKSMD